MHVVVTGASGFVGGYVVSELLRLGHQVTGVDDQSKYGPVARSYEHHPAYRLVVGDVRTPGLLEPLLADADQLIAGAALIGGINYFHAFPFDILAANEEIMAATLRAAVTARAAGSPLAKVTYLSSSMVYESSKEFPTPETAVNECPPPRSAYGLSKLAGEYMLRAAYDQYGLPFTVLRLFNCVGVGEDRALPPGSSAGGDVLASSHVLPDLVEKVLRGQDPLHVLGSGQQVRCYTAGTDLGRGIAASLTHPSALGEEFNLSTPVATTVRELAEQVWAHVHGPARPLHLVNDPALEHDVAVRVPDTSKAQRLLGFTADTPLTDVIGELVPFVRATLLREGVPVVG
jgi:nucleoside-diphosphate-sugar epimerase